MVVIVFDVGDLLAKRREWKVGKRSRGLLLKDGIVEGNGKGEEGRRGRRKRGEQPTLIKKNRSRAQLASSTNLAARLTCYRRHSP